MTVTGKCEVCSRAATHRLAGIIGNGVRSIVLCVMCAQDMQAGKPVYVRGKSDHVRDAQEVKLAPEVDKHAELGTRIGSFYNALINTGMPAETARSMTEDYMSRILDIAERVNNVPQRRAEAQPIAKPTIADVFREIMHESLRQAQQKRESSNDDSSK